MAGSIRLVRGKDTWELRVYIGRDSEGRVRHRHRTFVGTRRQAERELARLLAKQDEKPEPVPEAPIRWGPTTTINDAIEAWKENGWSDLSPKTSRGYEEIWQRYVRNSFGRRRIASLNPYEVERFFRSLKSRGAGKSTVRRVKALLHRSCRLAAKWSGGSLTNPVSNAELPVWSLNERRPEVRAPGADEVCALIVAVESADLRFGAFLHLLAATGVRRGEACALRWSNIDWEAGVLRVVEAVVAAPGGAVVKSPKTRASIRAVALDNATMAVLSTLHDNNRSLAEDCGLDLADDGFIFSTDPSGEQPPHPDAMSQAFSRVRKLAGVAADIHLHSLRHFHATALDPVISERQKQARLGWSTVQMSRHYTDAIREEDRRAAEHVGRLIIGRGSAGEGVPAPPRR